MCVYVCTLVLLGSYLSPGVPPPSHSSQQYLYQKQKEGMLINMYYGHVQIQHDSQWLPHTFLFQPSYYLFVTECDDVYECSSTGGCYHWCSSTGGCYHQCSSTVELLSLVL